MSVISSLLKKVVSAINSLSNNNLSASNTKSITSSLPAPKSSTSTSSTPKLSASTSSSVSKSLTSKPTATKVPATIASAAQSVAAKAKTAINQATMKAVANGSPIVKAIDKVRNAAGRNSLLASTSGIPFPGQYQRDEQARSLLPPVAEEIYAPRKKKSLKDSLNARDKTVADLVSPSTKISASSDSTAVQDNSLPTQDQSQQSGGEVTAQSSDFGANPQDSGFSSGSTSSSTQTGTTNPSSQSSSNQSSSSNQLTPLQKQSLAGGSYSFTTSSIANASNTGKNFQLSLDSITNDPFSSEGSKTDSKQALIESFSTQFANAFQDPQDFYDNLASNPELQSSLSSFIKAGGTPAMIADKIQPAVNDIQPEQDVATYLDQIGVKATPESYKALAALQPEKEIAQQEIMRQLNIPKNLQDMYFGTEEKVGLIQQKIDLAEEQKKILERKALADENNARAQAQYEIDKNNADAQIQMQEIEKNRLNAKNYMTGLLAHLGALNTSGAAGLALTTLDEKYQRQSMELNSKLEFANRSIQIDLTKSINDIEIGRDQDILNINEDLSKTDEQVRKEIFKAQQDAEKQIYDITSKYASLMRTTTQKYIDEAKSNLDKYNQSFFKLAGLGINPKSIPGMIDSQGRVITSKIPASAFAKKTGSSTEPVKGIGKPSYTGESLVLGSDQKKAMAAASELESKGIVSSDIVNVQKLLSQGYSLKAIAKATNMPTETYNALDKYIVKGSE